MKALKIFLIVLGLGVLITVISLLLLGYLRPKLGGIQIETTPPAVVFLDGIKVGKTPYQANRKPGEVVVKLVPESSGKAIPLRVTNSWMLRSITSLTAVFILGLHRPTTVPDCKIRGPARKRYAR